MSRPVGIKWLAAARRAWRPSDWGLIDCDRCEKRDGAPCYQCPALHQKAEKMRRNAKMAKKPTTTPSPRKPATRRGRPPKEAANMAAALSTGVADLTNEGVNRMIDAMMKSITDPIMQQCVNATAQASAGLQDLSGTSANYFAARIYGDLAATASLFCAVHMVLFSFENGEVDGFKGVTDGEDSAFTATARKLAATAMSTTSGLGSREVSVDKIVEIVADQREKRRAAEASEGEAK